MEKTGWRNVLCCLLIVLLLIGMILYVRELKDDSDLKGATLVQAEELMIPGEAQEIL